MDEHTVKSYDKELGKIHSLVFRMGEMVKEQISMATDALRHADLGLARDVIARDHMVNFLDVQAQEQIVNLLARRQPMASDLRTVMALSKTVTDLERVGDEAEAVARMSIHIYADGSSLNRKLLRDTYAMSQFATSMVNKALDAQAHLDVDLAIEVTKNDLDLDGDFQAALRHLATYIMEDSRNVGHAIDVTFVLKSLERIGDHAKNIAEYVIYQVKGKDVRHVSPESIKDEVLNDRIAR